MSEPTRRDRLRPVELIGISAVIAAFTGLIVLMSTRMAYESVVWAAVAFIISLVSIAMIALAIKPKRDELSDIEELDSQH